jgi:hypothetical protein
VWRQAVTEAIAKPRVRKRLSVAIIDRQSVVVHTVEHINHLVRGDLPVAIVIQHAHQQLHLLRAQPPQAANRLPEVEGVVVHGHRRQVVECLRSQCHKWQ